MIEYALLNDLVLESVGWETLVWETIGAIAKEERKMFIRGIRQ